MSTAASTIIANARRILQDTYDQAFADADLLAWLNESQSRFARETHVCQKATAVTIAASPYALSGLVASPVAEVLMVQKVLLTTPGTWVPRAEMGESRTLQASTETTPKCFWEFGGELYLDLSATGMTLAAKLFYSYVPTALATTAATLGTDARWDDAHVNYLLYRAYLQQRDAGLANGALNEFSAIAAQTKALTLGRAS